MEQYQEIQNAVLDQLQKDEATAVFNLWFKDLVLESIEGSGRGETAGGKRAPSQRRRNTPQ